MKGHWHSFYVLKPEVEPWLSDSRVHKLKHYVSLFANIKYVSVYLREDGNRHEDGQWWQNNNIKTESDENAMMRFNSMNLKKRREGGGGTEGEKKKKCSKDGRL